MRTWFSLYSSVQPGGARSETQQTIPCRAKPIRHRVSLSGWCWDTFVMMQTIKISPAVLCCRECLKKQSSESFQQAASLSHYLSRSSSVSFLFFQFFFIASEYVSSGWMSVSVSVTLYMSACLHVPASFFVQLMVSLSICLPLCLPGSVWKSVSQSLTICIHKMYQN